MAKEHHCPNCGAQPCNASSSTIHVCPVCVARWEEIILDEKAPAAPPKPVAPPASA